MRNSAKHRPLTFQVTFSVIVLVVFSLTLVFGFGAYAVHRVDQSAIDRQKAFIQSGIVEQVENLVREQQSVTVWDDSVTNAKAGDQDWMRENLGEWMYSYYGHDRVYVLDDRNRPIHAMIDGKTVEATVFSTDSAQIVPLVSRLRQILADNLTATTAAPTVVHDLILLDGTPAIVSVQPIVPSSSRVVQAPGTDYLDVSVQMVDATLIDKIAEHYQLTNTYFSSEKPEAAARVALVDDGGTTIGYLGWQPDQPGIAVIRQTAPALLGGVLLAGAVLIFLLRRLRRASKQLQTSENEAQYLAFHDTLTGLPNRALFEDRLGRALATVQRGRGRMALICLDLDRFKQVNDTLGHPAGDELVRQAARRLSNAVREVDTVARVGGDEFAIILIDIRDLRTAEDLCTRVLADLREPFELGGEQVFISASIGIAVAPELGTNPEELLRKADIALYEAKRGGRGRAQVFAGDMDDFLKHRLLIERELREALESEKGVKLSYQPVFAADGRTMVGADASLFWDHPVHGALPASQLLAIAEERGLIVPLSERMLSAACAHTTTEDLPWISLGLSPVFLRHDSSLISIINILTRSGLPAERLQIEISESVLLEGNATAMSTIRALREAGIRITIDDFGTGPSSLTALRLHPIDKLKIDRSFVRLLGKSDPAVAIVKALADLAIALGIRVAADGVETEAQLSALAGLGCHEVQGSLFATPPITLRTAALESFARASLG